MDHQAPASHEIWFYVSQIEELRQEILSPKDFFMTTLEDGDSRKVNSKTGQKTCGCDKKRRIVAN